MTREDGGEMGFGIDKGGGGSYLNGQLFYPVT